MHVLSGCVIDLVIILDSSYLESQQTWTNTLNFTASLVSYMNIGPNAVQVGLITMASDGINRFYLYNSTSQATLIRNILAVPYVGDFSNLAAAIRVAQNRQFLSQFGDRSYAPNVILVISAVAPNLEASNTISAAANAQSAGITIFSIGVDNYDFTTVTQITSSPRLQNYNYFLLSASSQLPNIVFSVLNVLCPLVSCPGIYCT